MKKNFIILSIVFVLLLICITKLVIRDYDKTMEIKSLKFKMASLQNDYSNDSTVLAEYQAALDSFVNYNPQAALEFSLLIEQKNIK